jgi:alpha(1,3/1,4) fucosyltransferase
MVTIAYINYWSGDCNTHYLTNFIKYHTKSDIQIVHHTSNPDFLIASVFNNPNAVENAKRFNAKCKIFYTGENTTLGPFSTYNNIDNLKTSFDIVIGFFNNNLEKNVIQLPFWITKYNYYDFNENDNIISYIENRYNTNKKCEKTIKGSLIASHDKQGHRTRICKVFEKYYNIEYSGSFKNNVKKIPDGDENKINYLKNCLFNICPENSFADNYITEKLFQAFEGGCIPIYSGEVNPNKNIILEHKYIYCNSRSTENIEENIKKGLENIDNLINGDKLFKPEASLYISSCYDNLKNAILKYV